MAEEEHVGPGSHSPLKSFWPGWSSGPCPSLMQTARTGAAARRPNASVTADSHPTQTTFCVVAVAPPQRNHPRTDFVVFLEFVIFCPLRSDRAVLRQTFLRELRERALRDRGEGRPVGPGHTRYEVARELRAEKIGRERRLRDTLSSKGYVRSLVGLGQKSVLVGMSPSKGIRCGARGTPPSLHGR